MKKLVLLLSFLAMVAVSRAKVELPPIIGSGMVLQQQSDVALWGKAKAGATVTVKTSWNNEKKSVKANADGAWLVRVATPSYGGPYTITISDGEVLTLDNVLIGEVWICSGQSNMEMPVGGLVSQPTAGALQAIINSGTEKNIRLYTVPRSTSDTPLEVCDGEWKVSSTESVAKFSATAYFFGLNLTHALGGVPIGLINTSWGGTMIQPWMPAACSERVMNAKYLNANPSEANPNRRMAYLYNAMIYPLRNFTARGFLWYQGESNLGQNKPGKKGVKVYTALMQEMVAQWRSDWGDKDNSMPFYYVQIAPYNYDRPDNINRALFVENQVEAMKLIPNSAMAATSDIGHPTCIHPPHKNRVGERLALLAMSNTYNMSGFPASGPVADKFEFKDGKAFVEFEPIMNGINAVDRSKLIGFEVCGEDKVFHAATKAAFISENVVEVSCDKVADPIAVRYGFRNYIDVNMYNSLGVPPFSFRSDNF